MQSSTGVWRGGLDDNSGILAAPGASAGQEGAPVEVRRWCWQTMPWPEQLSLEAAAVAALLALAAACGGSSDSPSGPSSPALPLSAESANFRYYYSPGDTVEVDRQEAYHAWALRGSGSRCRRRSTIAGTPAARTWVRGRASTTRTCTPSPASSRSIPVVLGQSRNRPHLYGAHRPAIRLLQRRHRRRVPDRSHERRLRAEVQRRAGARGGAALPAGRPARAAALEQHHVDGIPECHGQHAQLP